MKTATFPSLRVDPELRTAAESVLLEGESLSGFIEQSVRANVAHRLAQREFVARGLAARDAALADGVYVASGDVLAKLEGRLAAAKAARKKTRA